METPRGRKASAVESLRSYMRRYGKIMFLPEHHTFKFPLPAGPVSLECPKVMLPHAARHYNHHVWSRAACGKIVLSRMLRAIHWMR